MFLGLMGLPGGRRGRSPDFQGGRVTGLLLSGRLPGVRGVDGGVTRMGGGKLASRSGVAGVLDLKPVWNGSSGEKEEEVVLVCRTGGTAAVGAKLGPAETATETFFLLPVLILLFSADCFLFVTPSITSFLSASGSVKLGVYPTLVGS